MVLWSTKTEENSDSQIGRKLMNIGKVTKDLWKFRTPFPQVLKICLCIWLQFHIQRLIHGAIQLCIKDLLEPQNYVLRSCLNPVNASGTHCVEAITWLIHHYDGNEGTVPLRNSFQRCYIKTDYIPSHSRKQRCQHLFRGEFRCCARSDWRGS